MRYPFETDAIIDVTKPPYCADCTGKTDCTEILRRILDDILIREVNALRATHDKIVELSDGGKENVYIGLETARFQGGKLKVTYPEHKPHARIIYFPNGRYLVSDTVTYTLENLKQFWYSLPFYENCRNIHFLGESREGTVIRLADGSEGFGEGAQKPLISFVNNEHKVARHEEYTNVAFMNTIEDITLDCGEGNPGAVGIKYVSSNCGRIENVDIKTASGTCGIYVDNNSSQATFENISISGFDHGLDIANTAMLVLDRLDLSECKSASIITDSSVLTCSGIVSGALPTVRFREGNGRYYFTDKNITFANDPLGNSVYFEGSPAPLRTMPKNKRSENPEDFAFVDDFGAVGDGVTDSTRAIQRAMNSGKPIVAFGGGEYLINAKIKIPKTVKAVDFLFCSLACGIRLVGGEYDSAFEISEDSEDMLFIENLSAWENFRGHIRLVKHAAHRDAVFSDIHLMSASMYFNSVPGSRVYFDNCFLTTGTYTRDAWIPGDGFVPVYSHIIPYEFHGQTVYGRQVNPERADLAMLNDGSDILLDGFRTEGCGTALKTVNGGKTRICLFNAGIGYKYAENPLFETYGATLDVTGALAFGYSERTEYNILFRSAAEDVVWNSIDANVGEHGKRIDKYFCDK